MNIKSKLNQLICIVLISFLVLATLTPQVTEAAVDITVNPFSQNATTITGKVVSDVPIYVNVEGTYKLVSTDENGQFNIKLSEPIAHQFVYFYKKEGDFFKTIKQVHSGSFGNQMTPPNFYGVKDGKMVLQTWPGYEIVAVYEGETYVAKDVVHIPKKQGMEVKAYTRSGSTRSSTQSYRFDESVNIPLEIASPETERSVIQGKTFPYQTIKVTVGSYILEEHSDAFGEFYLTVPTEYRYGSAGFTLTAELVHAQLPQEIKTTKEFVPITINEQQPYKMLEYGGILEGYTYPDAEILYGDQTIRPNERGQFSSQFKLGATAKQELVFQRDGQPYATYSFVQPVDSTVFPFEVTKQASTVSGRVEGKTEPGVTLVFNSRDGEFITTASSDGTFGLDLPLFESGEYEVFLKTTESIYPIGKRVTIQEERPLEAPVLTFNETNLTIQASTFAESAEILVTKPDGDFDLKQVALRNGGVATIPFSYGDRYRIRVVSGNRVSPYVEGIYTQIQRPTFTDFEEGKKTIVGQTEPNATVTLYNSLMYREVLTVTADDSGRFTFELPYVLSKWTYRMHIKRPNGLGNENFYLNPKDVTVPRIYVDAYESRDAISEDAKQLMITSDDLIESSQIWYTIDGKKVSGIVEPKQEGSSSNEIKLFASTDNKTFKEAGVKTIEISLTNPSGLTTVTSLAVKDITPPKLDMDWTLYGESQISGTTDPGRVVHFGRTGNTVTQKADEAGRFTFKLPEPLTPYSRILSTISVWDEAGNKSTSSVNAFGHPIVDIRANIDGTKVWLANENRYYNYMNYELSINGEQIQLKNGEMLIPLPKAVSYPMKVKLILRNLDGSIKSTFEKVLERPSTLTTPKNLKASSDRRTITGQLDPYISFDIYDKSGKRITSNRAKADGSFAVAIVRPLVANESLRVVSKDAFGQTKSMTFKVADKTPPVKPTIQQAIVPLKQVTGKTEAGATVRITYRSKTYTTKADSKGIYRLNVSNWLAGQKISVTARDAAGNTSSAATTVILKAFRTASVSAIRTTSTSVSGKADAGATVKVYANNRQVGKTTRVGSSQSFKIAIPKQKKGTKMTVRIYRAGYATVERKLTVY